MSLAVLIRSMFALIVFQILLGADVAAHELSSEEIDPRLRSAFIIRALGAPKQYALGDEQSHREQLQTHFHAVLAILRRNTPASIEIAAARLQAQREEQWTDEQRVAWQRSLLYNRLQNMARLTAYRDEGRFPLNEGYAEHAVPIFVDRHETACAVGHLMRESDWQEEVAKIARDNRFVYIPDVRSGPVLDWVLTSGLTLEEAALIQPAYDFSSPDYSIDELAAGISITLSNLRFENFSFCVSDQLSACSVTDLTTLPHAIGEAPSLGVFAQTGERSFASGLSDAFISSSLGPDWLMLAPTANSGSFLSTGDDELLSAHAAYNVVVTTPNKAIDLSAAAGSIFYPRFDYNPQNLNSGFSVIHTIYDTQTSEQIARAHLAPGEALPGLPVYEFFEGSEFSAFEPRTSITVVNSFFLFFETSISSLTQEFRIVDIPEPTSLAMAITLVAFIGAMAKRIHVVF